ncbi:hypothetical protein L202_02705 [Cryptococcus amylolentus CBS 6039]|uniref:Ubiquitin-like protease family profile domain-containing protein n=1 Tax=Cryptococcus amylolentus CBS 6039 TaxID=1295533 RepID=A0A1E3HWB8_9TREE|nr:hypothetical protein L202_02705 [Cryptococcus amylolentus CBS 6039]ODN80465.1 hypothetical protein L202_02705 [Cryptococcus amylolentus CBS 6039]
MSRPKRPRDSDTAPATHPPKRHRPSPPPRPRQKQGLLAKTFGAMSSLFTWRQPQERDSEPESESESRSSSPDPLDVISPTRTASSASYPDPPSPAQPVTPLPPTSSSSGGAPQSHPRRPPVRPNRDAYSSSTSSPYGWQATMSHSRPMWPIKKEEDDRKASQRVITMFSGGPGGLKRRPYRKTDEKIQGIRSVLWNDQSAHSFDNMISPPSTPTYLPHAKREIGTKAAAQAAQNHKHYESSLVQSLRRLQVEREAKLKPPKPIVPKKMTADKEAKADKFLSDRRFHKTFASGEVDAASLKRLKPGQWLDDEIVNSYCGLMCERFANGKNGRKVHFMNSFFYKKLSEQGYAGGKLKRWTKKVDIFALDTLVFPINQGNMHWTACAINFARKRIEYYDSMGDHGNARKSVFSDVRDYLDQEYADKKGGKMDWTGWTDQFNKNTPQQNNGSDCGVFSLQTLEMVVRGRDVVTQGFEFTCQNMPFLRRLMVYEIGEGRLEQRSWGAPDL